MRILILLIIILSGCKNDNEVTCPDIELNHPDIAMYGDSLCDTCYNAASINGFENICKAGSKLIDLSYIDSNFNLVFLALGINDVGRQTPVSDYKNHLEYLLSTTDKRVVCILPNPHPVYDSKPYQNAMLELCTETINPFDDCGITLDHTDGVHYHMPEHDKLALCTRELF